VAFGELLATLASVDSIDGRGTSKSGEFEFLDRHQISQLLTFALLMYSLINGFAGCSRVS
jgi:hypothetical protein